MGATSHLIIDKQLHLLLRKLGHDAVFNQTLEIISVETDIVDSINWYLTKNEEQEFVIISNNTAILKKFKERSIPCLSYL